MYKKLTSLDWIRGALIVTIFMAVCSLISCWDMAEVQAKEFKPAKFKTTFTIVFNSQALEEASRLEDVIKRKFKDACSIKVELSPAELRDLTVDWVDIDTTAVIDADLNGTVIWGQTVCACHDGNGEELV